jgi:hypothetical protein
VVVDHDKINKWLKKWMPESAYVRSRLNKTDAQNFHIVVQANERRNEEA